MEGDGDNKCPLLESGRVLEMFHLRKAASIKLENSTKNPNF